MPLIDKWQQTSIGGVPLSNLHPKARHLSVNPATLNIVQTDPDYFKALITDGDTTSWESSEKWKKAANGWRPKDRVAIRAVARTKKLSQPFVRETADFFDQEVARMATTALHTAAYANGQTVIVIVKEKDIGFNREELEAEIQALLLRQAYRCALTKYAFEPDNLNPHLRTSLDRIDSAKGYVAGNLQIVTRAANFYKSASNAADWELKAHAMERMAVAIQRSRNETVDGGT